MRRFRYTLIIICLVLLYLGSSDLRLWLRNPEPLPLDVASLASGDPPREWLTLQGGYLDLLEAISTSGTIEVEAFLIPYRQPGVDEYRVMVETHDPAIVQTLTTYHFKLDSEVDKQRYLEQHGQDFALRRPVTGTVIGGLIRNNNKNRLQRLAKEFGVDVPDEVVFVSEGNRPPLWRWMFFLGVALAGMVKLFWRRPGAIVRGEAGGSDEGAA